MRKSLFLLSLVALFSLASVIASAQVTTSSMNGSVADENGEPLAGAAIIAVHGPSGTQYATIANENGRYFINGMRTGGPYTVEVSFLGMDTMQYNDVILKLGEAYTINVTMQSSNQLEAITIVGEKAFNASITGAGSSFNQAAVENMPTIDRSLYDIVKYTPQASMSKNGGMSFAGTNNRYNSFQVDGAVANDTFGLASSGTNGGQTGANPISLDAIEEVQVVIAPFDVRQSGFTGGAINAVTKSGTNTVTGSFYTYFNNQNMIGTTAGKLDEGETREKYDTQTTKTYGFTAGGPIIKNKLFVFFSGEYYKKVYPNIYTPANGTYDSIELSSDVITPDGTNLGNIFNTEMAEAILAYYEATYMNGASTGETYSQHSVTDENFNVLARFDWNISDRHKLMFRYQYMEASADQYGSGSYTYYFNNSSYKQKNKTNTLVLELNSRINDEWQNMFRTTGVFVRDHRETPYNGANMYIKDNVYVELGTEYSSGANSMDSNTFTITDNVSWYKGNHEFTFGTHNEIYSFNNLYLQYAYGGYTFNSIQDFFDNDVYQYNYRYADTSLTGGDPLWAATTHAAQFGLYAQDEWKPNNNFSLTVGLRLDMPVLMNDPTTNEEFNASEIAAAYNQYVGVTPDATVLFSPRVGFRWFLNDSHKTLLRGGTGLFTGRVPFVWLSNAYNNTGMEAKAVTITNPGSDLPLTSTPYEDIVESGYASSNGKATINTLSKDFKYPQVFRTNLGFEQIFLDDWKLTIDALYSKTFNNVFFQNLALTKSGSVYGVNAAVAETNPKSIAPYYSVDDTYQAVVALSNTNKGYSYTLSAQLQKSFHFGLDFVAAYTFGHSKSVNDGTSSVAYSNWKYNYSVDTNSPELSYSIFDKPHKVTAVVTYTSPYYLGNTRSIVSISYEGQSGQRYSYTMNESADFNGDGYTGNSLLYIPTSEEIGQMNWTAAGDAADFENYIRNDKYLNSHRGQWSERYAGHAPFENHFDVHFTQEFVYDKAHGRKFQVNVDLINATNLLNREWGTYYSSSYNLRILNVTSVSKDSDGNYTPTYHFNPYTLSQSDFYSRWRIQVGFRVTF